MTVSRTATSLAPPMPRQPVEHPALRSWLWLTIAVCVTVCLIAGWTFYVRAFTVDRYRQLPAGEPLVDHQGFRISPLAVTRVSMIADPSGYSEPEVAPPGSEFVLIDAEAVVDVVPDSYCAPELLGRDGQRWEQTSAYSIDVDSNCEQATLNPGVPARQLFIYLVPSTEIDHLYGITVEGFDGSADQVAHPAH